MQTADKKLGLWTSTSLVVGNMIGAGVFMMPSTLASFGGISLIGWVCSSIGAFLLSKVFAQARVYRVRSSRERKTRVAHGDWRTGGTAAVSTSNAAAVRNGVPVQPGWATVWAFVARGHRLLRARR